MEEYIYWEKQDSDELCAVYALNSLLQGPYFDAVSLAQIGQALDEQEQMLNLNSSQSHNVGESGYYSVQVITKALENHSLVMEYYSGELNKGAQPNTENAFICNRQHHWYTIRKLFDGWYDLNSLTNGPEHISEFYLSAMLSTVQYSGYSIFVVRGELPRTYFTDSLNSNQHYIPRALVDNANKNTKDDDDIQRAIQMSLGENNQRDSLEEAIQMSIKEQEQFDEAQELQKAIAMSLDEEEDQEGDFSIAIRMPEGFRINKKFYLQQTVEDLFSWVSKRCQKEPKLFESHPRREIQRTDISLQEAGLTEGVLLICEYRQGD